MTRWPIALFAAAVLTGPAAAQLAPDKALASMTAGEGLQVELFATEPMLVNPTSMDIDHRGRVWVAEAVNYRRKNFGRPILRPEGDRIVILTDTDGDGKADTSTVFYQGTDLYGPLSVCVIPQADGKALRVLVAQSPDILEFWDRDGDLKADGPPTKFLTGFNGFDHDHGVHGLSVGPDGKLYFTVGDAGVTGLQSKDGKGRKWVTTKDPKGDCQAGTVWRCDLDGNNLELIAHNFRNNYECCVDSFGEIWLSDNDDDGNQQTRICHVMPGGNYGYWPRGAGQTHWHEEQPGIVHKTLRTGFGSPTGICFYEGNLLPEKFRGQLIHADAGPREIRCFHRKPKGAGYELDKTPMLTSRDTWFRPSDVCVAPDGSVFVADWYDPGVGGHGMGDWTRGRIYRLTPKGHKGYKVPAVKLDTKEGVLAAIGSPCISTRTVAIQRLKTFDAKALMSQLKPALDRKAESVTKARAVWQFSHLWKAHTGSYPEEWWAAFAAIGVVGTGNGDPIGQERALGMRYRSDSGQFGPFEEAQSVTRIDPDAGVQREAILACRNIEPGLAGLRLLDYAQMYDGKDRFYLAALNIACGTDPVRRDTVLAKFDETFPEWNDKVADLVWELRPKSVLPRLGKLMADPKVTATQKARIVDILAANDDPAAGKTMLSLVTADQPAEVKSRAIENLRLFLPNKWASLKKGDDVRAVIAGLLKSSDGRRDGLRLAVAAPDCTTVEDIEAVAKDAALPREVRGEAVRVIGKIRHVKYVGTLKGFLPDPVVGPDAVAALGEFVPGTGDNSGGKQALETLRGLILDAKASAEMRKAAVDALAGTRQGTAALLAIKEKNQFPAELVADAGRLLRNSPFQGERNKAMILFPAPGKLDPKKLPAPAELAKRKGDAANGRRVMAASLTGEAQCLKCHTVQGRGGQIGPDLSMIGKKGSRENLFESILMPSKAVADQYVSWKLDTDDGQSITGLLVQETETTLTIRDANGKDYPFPVKGTERKKVLQSIMPEGLAATLTEEELVDLVEYLTTLQTPSLTPDYWHAAGPFEAALDTPAGVEGKPFDLAAKFKGKDGKEVTWRVVRPTATGYVDLAAFHGAAAPHSATYLTRVVESPAAQDATLVFGTDDGCRVWVNGEKVFGHDRTEAASPDRDRVAVKLKPGANAIVLKVGNGNNPHGFYLSVVSPQELKLAK